MIKKILICVVFCFQTASIIASSADHNNGLAGATSSSASRASAGTPANLVTTQPGTTSLPAISSTNALQNLAGDGSTTTTIGGSGSAMMSVLAVLQTHIQNTDDSALADTVPASLNSVSTLQRPTAAVVTAYAAHQQQIQNDQNTASLPGMADDDDRLDQLVLPNIHSRSAANSIAGSGARAAQRLVRPASKRAYRRRDVERSEEDVIRHATESISAPATTSITLSDEQQQALAARLHTARIGNLRPPSGLVPVAPASIRPPKSPQRTAFGRSNSPARGNLNNLSVVFPSSQRPSSRTGGVRITPPRN